LTLLYSAVLVTCSEIGDLMLDEICYCCMLMSIIGAARVMDR